MSRPSEQRGADLTEELEQMRMEGEQEELAAE